MPPILRCVAIAVGLWSTSALAQNDVADVPSQDRHVGKNENQQYFLIGSTQGDAPKAGRGLLVVLPGGDGSADFNPFMRRVHKNAVPEGWLIAQLVAPHWTEAQSKSLVWPTAKDRPPEAKFSTEEFIAAVVKDVQGVTKIDPKRVFGLAWSSGGPALYASALADKTPLRGAFVAMSVFRPERLDLKNAKGRAFYLYQSKGDEVCKFSFAEAANKALDEKGAAVTLVEYEGGHGWHGDVFGDIRAGVEWLEAHADGKAAAKSADSGSPKKSKSRKSAGKSAETTGVNLLSNGDFESGLDGWDVVNNSGRLEADNADDAAKTGKKSLRLKKTGGMPMDVVRFDIADLHGARELKVSAAVKCAGVKNTFVKFFVYDAADQSLVNEVDVKRLSGTSDWKRIEKTYKIPEKAAKAAVMIAVVLDGTVWIDDIRVEAP